MPTDALQASLESQRALLRLCGTTIVDGDHATSFCSEVRRDSGFFAATIPRRESDPTAVVAQARQVAQDTGRPQFVWSSDATSLAVECWQQGLEPVHSLAVMTKLAVPGDGPSGGRELLVVHDHASAALFREVHQEQFRDLADPDAAVSHFARDAVLLQPSVHAVVGLEDGEPVAAGFRHLSGGVAGIYWVATKPSGRGKGHGSAVTGALVASTPLGTPVVLQATRMGRPVYRRAGFHDQGLVWCWVVRP